MSVNDHWREGENVEALMPPIFRIGDHAETAEALLNALSPQRDLVMHDSGEIRVYSPSVGIWELVELETLR